MRDHEGKMLEMILNSHRRIRILQPLDPPQTSKDFSTLNGRRSRSSRRKTLEASKENNNSSQINGIEDGEDKSPQQMEEHPIIFARTENVIVESPQMTQEIKVEIVSIRVRKDMINNRNRYRSRISTSKYTLSPFNFSFECKQLCP
jgi:hypothetical protein